MPDRDWENFKEIFHAATALPANERAAYLDKVCGGDLSLRAAVQSLLDSHDQPTHFLDKPAYQAAANVIVERNQFQAGQTVAHYTLLSLLGEGGMGQVYLAEDTKLHRQVSLKFLSHSFADDAERLRRFEQEAHAISALNHPNTLTIYEISEIDGRRFIATEFIDGQTLRERLSSRLNIDEALEIAIQIGSALVAAHRLNIVHRDIKPENIMIRNDDGLVKVLDFGLAKAYGPRGNAPADSTVNTARLGITAPGVVMGTVSYMSPEQARGQSVDERTDVWSLGVVLYEMVAGCSPFAAGTSNEILSSILSKTPAPPLARFVHNVPERLEEIVEKALTKNKEERYQTSKDLLIDLKRLQQTLQLKAARERSTSTDDGQRKFAKSEGETPGTQPASSAEYIVNQVKSHKRAVLTGFAVMLVIALGLFFYTWRFRQTTAPLQSDIKSLAVLPLKSLNTSDDYVGLGIADAVIRRVSQTGTVIVRPMSAVRRYLNEETDALAAAKQLGVDSVLEGTVQHSSDQLRVSVNLLRVSDGASLWADSFDMRMSDIFTVQDKISRQLAATLQLKLTAEQANRFGQRYTSNAEAYEYYTKGRTSAERFTTAIGDREAIDASIDYFKKAVELDPNYALAHAELGQAYMWMANFNDPDNPVWVGLAQQSLAKAESIDPRLAEIHGGRFQYYFSKYGNWDLAHASREARQAVALNPSIGHSALGIIYDHLGLDETVGLRATQLVLEIDPTNVGSQARLVESYELYGRFDDAIDAQHRFFGTTGPAFSLMAKGKLDEAQPLLEAAIKKNSGDLRARAKLALILALRGRFDEAEAAILPILQEARNNRSYHHITYDIACIYALSRKSDQAVKWLRTTADTGMPNYPLFARDPWLDRIRGESVFVQFMTELKQRWDKYKEELQ